MIGALYFDMPKDSLLSSESFANKVYNRVGVESVINTICSTL